MAPLIHTISVVYVAVQLLTNAQAELSCPTDYQGSEELGICIKVIVDNQLTWADARDACQINGADLVKITNTEVNDFVVEVASWYPYLESWIGLHDQDNPSTFVWLDEESEASWTNWAVGEPADGDANCIYILEEENFRWRTLQCDTLKDYICGIMIESTAEIDLIPTVLPEDTSGDEGSANWMALGFGLTLGLVIIVFVVTVVFLVKKIKMLSIEKASPQNGTVAGEPKQGVEFSVSNNNLDIIGLWQHSNYETIDDPDLKPTHNRPAAVVETPGGEYVIPDGEDLTLQAGTDCVGAIPAGYVAMDSKLTASDRGNRNVPTISGYEPVSANSPFTRETKAISDGTSDRGQSDMTYGPFDHCNGSAGTDHVEAIPAGYVPMDSKLTASDRGNHARTISGYEPVSANFPFTGKRKAISDGTSDRGQSDMTYGPFDHCNGSAEQHAPDSVPTRNMMPRLPW